MKHPVLLHPDAVKYLDSLSQKERRRIYQALKGLGEDPYTGRSGCDIKRLRGKHKTAYRLRVGDHRLLYVVVEGEVLVEEAFRREKGY